jgi:hypothetical protein
MYWFGEHGYESLVLTKDLSLIQLSNLTVWEYFLYYGLCAIIHVSGLEQAPRKTCAASANVIIPSQQRLLVNTENTFANQMLVPRPKNERDVQI